MSNQSQQCQIDGVVPLPDDAPGWITPELVARTIRVWQRYYAARLTPQDAILILSEAGRLLDVLRPGA